MQYDHPLQVVLSFELCPILFHRPTGRRQSSRLSLLSKRPSFVPPHLLLKRERKRASKKSCLSNSYCLVSSFFLSPQRQGRYELRSHHHATKAPPTESRNLDGVQSLCVTPPVTPFLGMSAYVFDLHAYISEPETNRANARFFTAIVCEVFVRVSRTSFDGFSSLGQYSWFLK